MNVDWDLLADHLGGALAGTPDGVRVERLMATDPSWARAATELSVALDAVARDLRTLPAVTMPDDITAWLDHALASTVAPDVAAAGAPGGRSAGESRRPPAHPGRRRRRRMARWSAGLAVAASVAAFAGYAAIGVDGWEPDQAIPGLTDSGGDDSADGAAPDSFDEPPGPEPTGPLVVATGSDYDATTLEITEPARSSPRLGPQNVPSPPQQAPEGVLGGNEAPPVVPDPLVRLWSDPTARTECLAMIAETIQPPPVVIDTVDFATYEGKPALIIWASAGDGSRWAWVSGPACGAVSGDPDVRYETQIS